ncbi:MAG TPA: SDR family NAD(P)-dependent oxidoreductase, partial [Salinarimonas sp.]|nr:SDR family NAD(P)-dependent oxidoreductase [Salinarimonas sp.]
MRLSGKTALVTGAAQGYGRGIAETFAREGARVAVLDLQEGAVREVAQALGGGAIPLAADVSRADDVERASAQVLAAFGGLDILVNNAGVSHRNQPMLDVAED